MRPFRGDDDRTRLRHWFQSNKHLLFLVALSLLATFVLLQYQPQQQPILRDRAYLILMAQGLYRGESIYETTTLGYPPLAFMVSAGMMHLSKIWTTGATYLAPRWLSIPLAVLSLLLLYTITYKVTRKLWAGLAASLTLLSFELFKVMSVSNLEPKLVLQFLMLLGIWALQRRRWWLAGLAAALAVCTWQVAVIFAFLTALIAVNACRGRSWKPFSYFAFGFVIGLAPAISYLLLTGQLDEFIQQAFLIKLLPRTDIVDSGLALPKLIFSFFGSFLLADFLLMGLAVIGFLYYFRRLFKRGWKLSIITLLFPRHGGVFLLSVLWIAYLITSAVVNVEFLGIMDILPIVALIAFWTAWGCLEVLVRAKSSTRIPNLLANGTPVIFTGVLLAVIAVEAFRFQIPYTLREEEDLVNSVVTLSKARGGFLALNAEEFYVITEQSSPWRYLRMTPYFVQIVDLLEENGCERLLQDLEREKYPLIIIKERGGNQADCLDEIVAYLQTDYQQSEIAMAEIGCSSSELFRAFSIDPVAAMKSYHLGDWFRCITSDRRQRASRPINVGSYQLFRSN